MQKRYIASGFIFLLATAYLDNVRGVLLPLLKDQFHLSYTQTSLFLVGSYVSGIIINTLLNAFYQRFGENKISITVAIGSILAILFGFFVENYLLLLFLGLLIGAAVATLNSLCNILVLRGSSLSSRTRLLCALHMMYGIGCLAAPAIASYLLKLGFSWPFTMAIWPIPLLILAIFFLKKLPTDLPTELLETNKTTLTSKQSLAVTILCFYAAGEIICTMWMVIYLMTTYNYSLEGASSLLSGFFLVFIFARLIGTIFTISEREKLFIYFTISGGIIAFALGLAGYPQALILAGIMGPFFPIFLGRVSNSFPLQIRPITVWTITGIQISLCLLNLTMGILSDHLPIYYAYHLPLCLMILTFILVSVYFRLEEN